MVLNYAMEQFKMFTYDMVYDWNSTQEEIYNDTAYPKVYWNTMEQFLLTGKQELEKLLQWKDTMIQNINVE